MARGKQALGDVSVGIRAEKMPGNKEGWRAQQSREGRLKTNAPERDLNSKTNGSRTDQKTVEESIRERVGGEERKKNRGR